ncbi:cobalt ECF transporter T component CbiQ [Porphyromonas pogonae]|uniref:cobalt ECF transporter T component CbiQ n=1 Tax=Porphyromonas pogonae TaxID=867595 RepID=UPI002E7A6C85|nr:cobalt ECF transporter T component CbiQ [Porphyromonas pogonae]
MTVKSHLTNKSKMLKASLMTSFIGGSLLVLVLLLAIDSDIFTGIVAGVIFLVRLVGKASWRKLFYKRMLWLQPFLLPAILPVLFVRVVGGQDSLWNIWGWGITDESLSLFVHIYLRCLGAIALVMNLTVVCPVYYLLREMRRVRVPGLLVELFELVYRYIFLLGETAHNILIAQKARLGYCGVRNRMHHSSMLFGQTLVLAYSEADRFYHGMVSRGGGGEEEREAHPYLQGREEQNDALPLQVKDLCFSYVSGKEILTQISFDIERAQKIVLLGSNGAGKSTLFLLLDGILKSNAGDIVLGDIAIDYKKESVRFLRRHIALVFQNSNYQLFAPTVEEEIAFGLKNMGLSGEELDVTVEKVIAQYELGEIRTLPPHKLSEGQKKWVAIAAVLACNPSIVILDEPTSNLDCYYTHRVIELLDELYRHGKVVIISTHDMNLAYEWGERAIVMDKGELIADGSVIAVFNDRELLVRANLEQPAILRLQGTHLPYGEVEAVEDASAGGGFLPLFLKSGDVRCLIVGGGQGALKKAMLMQGKGVKCTLLAPEICADMTEYVGDHSIPFIQKDYCSADICDFNLVVAATGDRAVEEMIARDAKEAERLVCSISYPELGNFEFAALCDKEGLQIAIHTYYSLPVLTRKLKEHLQETIPVGLAQQLAELSLLRKDIITYHKEQLDISQINRLQNKYEQLMAQVLELLKL